MYRYILLLIFSGIGQIAAQAQADTLLLFQMNTQLDNGVLIEGCDTFKTAIKFYNVISAPTSFLITRAGTAGADDYWMSTPDSFWVTPDNPVWDMEIYPIQDNIAEGEECIVYKVENIEDGYLNTIKLKVYDEFPEHYLEIESGNDDSETMCENDYNATINIQPGNGEGEIEDTFFGIEETITLFENDTIEHIQIDVNGINDCDLFNDIFLKTCFSINYPNTENLKITLLSPDDKSIVLFDGEIAVQIMSQSCFDRESDVPIEDGSSVYYGDFQPTGDWDSMENAQLNGIWTLIFETNTTEIQGECSHAQIHFDTYDRRRLKYWCDWFATPRTTTEFIYPLANTPLGAGEFNIEVQALNCTYDLSTYVYERSTLYYDTIVCRNSTANLFNRDFQHPQDSLRTLISNSNANNCDSVFQVNVTYQRYDYDLDFQFLEEGQTILFDGLPVDEEGFYSAVYENELGCDSMFHTVVIPAEAQAVLYTIPDAVSGTSAGCQGGICIPFLTLFYSNYDYFVDGEMIDYTDITLCESAPYSLYSTTNVFSWLSEEERKISNLVIDSEPQEGSFCVSNSEELVHILNYFMPDLGLILNNDSRLYCSREFHLAYDIEELSSGNVYSYDSDIGYARSEEVGVYIPMSEGIHEVKIKHKYSDVEKIVTVNLEEHSFPVLDTLKLNYLGQVNQSISFPLPALDLCGEIISATEICSEISPGIADFTLTNQGLLTLKPLIEESFELCMEICDAKNICQIVLFAMEFPMETEEEEEEELYRSMYPNPVQSILHLSESEESFFKQIRILDVTGKTIESVDLEELNVYQLDVSRYAEGLYFLVRKLENGETIVEKFVVQR